MTKNFILHYDNTKKAKRLEKMEKRKTAGIDGCLQSESK